MSPAPSPAVDVACAGFYARIAADADAVAAIGKDETDAVRVTPGWWDDTWSAADGHRVTYFGMERPLGASRGSVLLQVDMWISPEVDDPDAALAAVDGSILALVNGQWWIHDGRRLIGRSVGARDFPARAGRPLRRMREFRVLVG